MELCKNSKRNNVFRILGIITNLLNGLLLGGFGFYVAFELAIDTNDIYAGLFIVFIGVAILAFGIFIYMIEAREYQITEEGIIIRYFRHFEVRYPWSSVIEIVICESDQAPKDADAYDTVIRILAGFHQKEDLRWQDNWTVNKPQIKHFRQELLITYSEARLEEIKLRYHAPIRDMRRTGQGRTGQDRTGQDRTGDGSLP